MQHRWVEIRDLRRPAPPTADDDLTYLARAELMGCLVCMFCGGVPATSADVATPTTQA